MHGLARNISLAKEANAKHWSFIFYRVSLFLSAIYCKTGKFRDMTVLQKNFPAFKNLLLYSIDKDYPEVIFLNSPLNRVVSQSVVR